MVGSRAIVPVLLALWTASAQARAPQLAATVVVEPARLTRTVPTAIHDLDVVAKHGQSWRLETEHGAIHVWIPDAYDPATAATIVFVHGYRTDCDTVWTDYRLPEQFALSGINAMFVVPEAPDGKRAKLAWPSLDALVARVHEGVDVAMPAGRLVAVGHSGAYRTLANWLPNKRLDTVVLLDAVYGEYRFAPWVRRGPDRRLLNIAYETTRYSDYMHKHLPTTQRVIGLPLFGFPDARIVYAKTDVGHWKLVTDGVALPMALRALDLPFVYGAPLEVPLGLSPRGTDSISTKAVTQRDLAASTDSTVTVR